MLRKVFNWGFPVVLFLLLGFCVAKTDIRAWVDLLGTVSLAGAIVVGIAFWVISVSETSEEENAKETD